MRTPLQTLIPGLSALAATAMPEIMPPPLTGTMIASSSGTCISGAQGEG